MNLTHKRLIEKWAESVLDDYAQLTGSPVALPIPVVDIAEKVFGLRCDIVDLSHLNPDFAGIMMPAHKRIVANENCSPSRLAFTIAHELVHWAVDCTKARVGEISVIRSLKTSKREPIAEQAAGALLMPRRLLEASLKRRRIIDRIAISEMSNEYGVSYDAFVTRLRKIQSGAYPIPVIINWYDLETGKANSRYLSSEYWSTGRDWLSRFYPWLPSTQNDLGPEDTVLVFGNFDQIDVRTARQIRDIKTKVTKLFVANLDKPEALYGICALCDVDHGFVFSSRLDLDGQINILAEELGCDLKVINIPPDNWLQETWFKPDGKESSRVWVEYDFQIESLARTNKRTETRRKQRFLIGPDRAIPARVTLHKRREASRYIRQQKKNGKVVVLATGCFDVLTIAHIHFLKQAKAAGDILVVGVENDNRVTLFKGMLRPVNTIAERVEVLEMLKCVDFTFVIYGLANPDLKPFYTQLYTTLGPDILAVSESDAAMDDRREEIEAAGGRLEVVQPYEMGVSSTSMLKGIIAQHPETPQVWHIPQPILMATGPGLYRKGEGAKKPRGDSNSQYVQLALPMLT